ncbi:MAG: zinc-binding dehydrogenase, partial [Halorientalis sp.]
MSTGFMAAEHAEIPIGGTVAVFALGPVGLMAVTGTQLQGAGRIIGVDTVDKRMDLAEQYGADETVDFEEVDPVAEIESLTDGRGVDAAIEALGANTAFEACIEVTRPGGTISNVGYHGQGEYVTIPREAWGVGMAEKDIVTGLCPGGRLRLERLLGLLETGRVDPTSMTTHEFDFADVDEAFELMASKSDGVIKPLIDFE